VSRRGPWWEYEPSGPIAVEGGVRARSKRGAIGEQWWSRRFIAVLESYGMAGRLQRGRSYARRGQVIEFQLAPGEVTALVQGSRPRPYQVSVMIRLLTVAQWRAVEARLASQALFRARLLAGEMPAEIEEVFASCGTPLFPQAAGDLEMDCSCPDWEVPCKHLAAVCYVLAEAFDDDPFAMLAWRGKPRDELLAALRGRPAGSRTGAAQAGQAGSPRAGFGRAASGRAASGRAAEAPPGTAHSRPASPAAAALADVTGAADPDPAAFWTPGLSPARLAALPPSPAAPPDLLLRLADPPAIEVRGLSLRDLLTPLYTILAAHPEPPGPEDIS
jgi:uncharacterized Zn finger protein